MFRIRVFEGKYYPERKGWFFWRFCGRYFWSQGESVAVPEDSEQEARDVISQYKRFLPNHSAPNPVSYIGIK